MRSKKRFLFLFFILIRNFSLSGQQIDTANKENPYRFNKAYIKSYWFDTRDIALSPFQWSGKQWMGLAGVTAVSILVYLKDEQIQKVFQKNRSHGGDECSKYILEPWGFGVYSASLVAAFYLEGMINKNERSKKMALLGTKTLLITAIYSRIPKYTLQRHRPFQDIPGQPKKWEGPLHGITEYTSFPSGHSVSAFALATVISNEYADHWAVPIIAYSLAGVSSLSRIYDNKHWASDVLVGAAFGYAMGKLIYNNDNWLYGKKNRKKKRVE